MTDYIIATDNIKNVIYVGQSFMYIKRYAGMIGPQIYCYRR